MAKRMLCELWGELTVGLRKTEAGRYLLYPTRSCGEERHGGAGARDSSIWMVLSARTSGAVRLYSVV